MDKKIRNRILYVAVAALWGTAIYRTFKNYQIASESEAQETVSAPALSPIQFNKDSFDLELPDRDPFLGSSWSTETRNENARMIENPKSEIHQEKPAPVERTWPQIEYFGFVKNRNKNSTLCLLKVDGHLIQLSKGQQHNNIIVMHTYRDSVLLAFDGMQKTIRK